MNIDRVKGFPEKKAPEPCVEIGMGLERFQFYGVIEEISAFPWSSLSRDDMVDVAWAYHFFSIQFRECLVEARRLYPEDENLRKLEAEECDTDNLSPWPSVAAVGERLNHDEYMRRVLALMPCAAAKAEAFKAIGDRYLAATRSQPSAVLAASLGELRGWRTTAGIQGHANFRALGY